MQFSVAALVGALAAVANAKAVLTNSGFDIQAGQSFTLTWTNATGPVKVELVNGPSDNLKPFGSPLASDVSGNSFTWTPPSSLPTDKYAFRVTDSTGVPNFSKQFDFQGTASPSSSTSASSTTVSSTTSSASSTTSSAASTTSASTSTTSATSSANSTTVSTSTVSKTSSTVSSASHSASSTSAPVNTNAGERFSSSLALVLGAVMALVAFN